MNKLKSVFKKLFTGKKLFVVLLLFFVLGGLILPKLVFSANLGLWCSLYTGGAAPVICAPFMIFDIVKKLGGSSLGIFNGFIYAITVVPLTITEIFAGFSGTILNWVSWFAFNITYTKNNVAVDTGWPIVRDLANMFVILGVVVVAIAFTLRLESYGSKKVLINLIIAAFLINFSPLICAIFIDGSNIISNYFISKSGNGIVSSFSATIKNLGSIIDFDNNENPIATLSRVTSIMIFNIIATFVFLLYAALLLFRIVALWALVILSPLAFVCFVFPFTKQYFTMWWNNFFQWVIIGMPAGLFMYIGSKMLADSEKIKVPIFSDIPGGAGVQFVQALSSAFSLFVPAIFLIIGFLFSLKTTVMGANMITSRAGAYAWKGGKFMAGKTAGVMDKMTGNRISAANRYMKNKAMQWGEATKILPKGYAAQATKESVKTEYDRLSNLPMPELKQYAGKLGAKLKNGKRLSAPEEREAAAMGRILVEEGEFDSSEEHKKLVNLAQQKGFRLTGEHKRKNPMLAPHDSEAIRKATEDIRGENIRKGITMSEIEVAEAARMRTIQDTVQKQSAVDFRRNLPAGAMTPEIFASMNQDQIDEMMTRGPEKTKEQIIGFTKTKKDADGSIIYEDSKMEMFKKKMQNLKNDNVKDKMAENISYVLGGSFNKRKDADEDYDDGTSRRGGRGGGGGGFGSSGGMGGSRTGPTITPPSSGESYNLEGEGDGASLSGSGAGGGGISNQQEQPPTEPQEQPGPQENSPTLKRNYRSGRKRGGFMRLPLPGEKTRKKVRGVIKQMGEEVAEDIAPIRDLGADIKKGAGKIVSGGKSVAKKMKGWVKRKNSVVENQQISKPEESSKEKKTETVDANIVSPTIKTEKKERQTPKPPVSSTPFIDQIENEDLRKTLREEQNTEESIRKAREAASRTAKEQQEKFKNNEPQEPDSYREPIE